MIHVLICFSGGLLYFCTRCRDYATCAHACVSHTHDFLMGVAEKTIIVAQEKHDTLLSQLVHCPIPLNQLQRGPLHQSAEPPPHILQASKISPYLSRHFWRQPCSLVADALQRRSGPIPRLLQLGTPDDYLPHGAESELHVELGLDASGIAAQINKAIKSLQD